MATNNTRNNATTPPICMPAMPPMGVARRLGQWLRSRRPAAGSDLSRLDPHLLNDLGVESRREARLTERQLAAFYEQPLGQASGSYTMVSPAEQHTLRIRRSSHRPR